MFTEKQVKEILDGAATGSRTRSNQVDVVGDYIVNKENNGSDNELVADLITFAQGSNLIFNDPSVTSDPYPYYLIKADKIALKEGVDSVSITVRSQTDDSFMPLVNGKDGFNHTSRAATGAYGERNNGGRGDDGAAGGEGTHGQTLPIGLLVIAANEILFDKSLPVNKKTISIKGYGINGGNGGNGGNGQHGGHGGQGGASIVEKIGFVVRCVSGARTGGPGGDGGPAGIPGEGVDGGAGMDIILFGSEDFRNEWARKADNLIEGGQAGKGGKGGKGGEMGMGGPKGRDHRSCRSSATVGDNGRSGDSSKDNLVKKKIGQRGQIESYNGTVTI